jgi:hypothetical protein
MSVFLVGFFNFLVGIVYKLISAYLHYNERTECLPQLLQKIGIMSFFDSCCDSYCIVCLWLSSMKNKSHSGAIIFFQHDSLI